MIDLLDPAEIRAAIATLYRPDDVFELRVLEGRDREGENGRAMQWAGWFTGGDAELVIGQLRRLRGGWHGVYTTANPTDPLLLQRQARRLEPAKRNATTTDAMIPRRRWLLSDFDPTVWGAGGQVKGIAATDDEKAHALERAAFVAGELEAAGFPAPVRGDSGNGGHLLYRVDLPGDSHLPERFAKALAALYGDKPGKPGSWDRSARVEVDTSIFNPARIWKLYGTLACKGAGQADRPWRMARLLDVPFDGGQVLDAGALEAWIEAAEARAGLAAAPAASSSTPAARAAPGPRAGAPASSTGAFDPRELAAGAGLELSAPRTRADGATFYEIRSACPGCQRDRVGWISVAESGAVGLGCRTASCAFSDSAGRPGEHWKAWRATVDPDYSPDAGAPAARPERGAAAKAFAERHAPAASSSPAAAGIVAAILDGAAPEAEIPPPPPARAHRQVVYDGRARILASQDPRDIRDQVLEALAASPGVYVSQGKLATEVSGRMLELGGGALDSAVVDTCRIVEAKRDRSSGEFVDHPKELPVRVRGMLAQVEALGPEVCAKFRQVDQVTRTPFFTPSGESVTVAGYSAEARTLLVDPPVLEDRPEPDGAACLAYLRELVADFPFQGGLYGAEVSNLIGAMLVPMVRPLIVGPVPMLIIEGNVPGIGKSFLASAIRILYGLEPEAGSLPKDELRVASLMLGILMKSEPVHVFDDVTHSVISATLNRTITGRTYSDRILGVSDTASYVIRQLWIMTMNNARVSADLVRRVFRSRLRFDGPGRPEDRRGFKHPDFLAHVEANRPAILSRLRQLVAEWINAGRPIPDDLPMMGSFEGFARVIGSILRHAGDRAWLANANDTKESVAMDDDWIPFLAAWHTDQAIGGQWGHPQRPGQLHAFAAREGLLGSILGGGGNDAAQIARLGYGLKQHRDQALGGYRVLEERDHRGIRVYRVEAVATLAVEPSPSVH